MTPDLAPRRRGAIPAAALLLALIGWMAALSPVAAQTFPPLTGRVVDQADLLSSAVEAELTTRLEALERDTSDQVVVVTVKDLQGYEIEDYGYRLGRAWGIGQKDQDNGVLLIVAQSERRVRIEVGYGLEPILTDALSALIIHDRILPAFREGGFERGITDGVDAIETQLRLDPAEAEARAAAARPVESPVPVGAALVIGLIFLFLFLSVVGAASRGRRRRGKDGLSPVLVWIAAEALKNASSGRGRGGGWGGGGFGGGGFGGGGGGFGGGGASGGW